MGSSHVLGPDQFGRTGQLPMFMSTSELMDADHVVPGDLPGHRVETGNPSATPEELWERKASESLQPGSSVSGHAPDLFSDRPSLVESLRTEGIRNAIPLAISPRGSFAIMDGHHRVAAARELSGKGKSAFVPVEFHDVDEDMAKEMGV